MVLKFWLDGFLSRSFQRIQIRTRRPAVKNRRRSAQLGRGSELLEVRQLLTADLGTLLATSSLSPTGDLLDHDGHPEDDPPITQAVPPQDVAGSYLTSPGGADNKSYSFNDIFQGATDDCVFMSSLSAVARTQLNLGSNISLASQNGNTSTYLVTLYRAVSVGSSTTYMPDFESVTFDGTRQAGDAHFGDSNEFWPIIYERAYLQFADKFALNYHSYEVALTALTGKSTLTTTVTTTSGLSVAQALKDNIDEGVAEITGTYDSAGMLINSQYGIVGNHAYTVIGVEIPANGDLSKTYVTVRNPWGIDTAYEFYDTDHDGNVSGDEYVKSQSGVDGADDGQIRIPWSVFTSSFKKFSDSGAVGPSINTPLPQPVKFDQTSYGPFTVYEGQPLSVNFHAVDPAGHTVLYWSDMDQPGNIHPQTGLFTWTPMNGDYGDQYFEIHADAGPSTTGTIGFVVHVLPGSPIVHSTTVSPTTLHDDGSDLVTITSNVTVPYGQISDVAFYSDANNNGTYEPGVDPLLGGGDKSGNNYSWTGYVGGMAVGTHNFFVIATRYDHDLFRGYAVASASVVAATHADPVAIPIALEAMFTTPDQDESVIRALPDAAGNLYVLIRGPSANGSTYEQAVGKFDPAGNLVNGTNVAESTPQGNNNGQLPDLVVLADGSFAVIWQEYNTPSFGLTNILVRWYDKNLQPTSSQTTVVTGSAWAQNAHLRAAGDASGNLLIVYNAGGFMADDVWAVSVARNGTITRAPWMVNSHAANSQKDPEVALNANGDGVIVWPDLDQGILIGRKVSSAGVTNGAEFNVTTTFDAYAGLAAAVAQNGDFYISYVQNGIFVRKYPSSPDEVGTEILANTFGGGTFSAPQLALSSSGWLAVGWGNSIKDGNAGGFIQILNPYGVKFGPEFAPSNTPAALQGAPVMVMNPDGDLAAFWSQSTAGTGGKSYNGVYKRFFTVDLPPTFDPLNPLSIPENSPAGTAVGSVHAFDPDPGSSVSYSLQDAGTFQINASTGQITVAAGAVLDYETQQHYYLSVLATSGTKTTFGTVEIDITNVNEAPTLTPNAGTYRFTANNSPVLFADSILADVDTTVFSGGNLIAKITNNGSAADKLSFSEFQGVSVNASNDVLLNGTVIGTLVSSGNGTTPLQVNLNAKATIPVVQTLINALQFEVVGTPASLLSRTITVTVNDGQLTSNTVSRVVSVVINTAPVLGNAGDPVLTSIPEDVALASNTGTLISALIASMGPAGSITDADPGAKQGIAITVADQTHGTWQFTTDGTTWTNFGTLSITSALQLASDGKTKVRFLPNADYNGIATFTYVAWDQRAGVNGGTTSASARGAATPFSVGYDTAVLTVTPVNDAPVLSNAGTPTLSAITEDVTSAGNPGVLISALIAAMGPSGGISDVDLAAKRGIAITVADQAHGTWQFTTDGTTWAPVGALSVSNARLLASDAKTRVRFVPNLDYSGNATFTYVGWDQTTGTNGTIATATARGFATAFSLGYETATITVTPMNDAPVLNNAGSPALTSIAEDVALASNAGTLISSLIASMSPLGSISDVDLAAKRGIAITVADQTHGTWQFTTNGTTWINFGTLSLTNALLLASDANTKVRFLPNADYNGVATFTYVAWDQTAGTNGATASAASRGFTTPFSLGYDTAILTITPVNDAPILNPAGFPVLSTITEDLSLANNTGTLISSLIASMSPLGSITDVDAAAKKGIAISVADQTHGVWQFTTDGTTWTPFGAVSATAALQLASDAKTRIRFVANANYNGISTFTFVAWDQTTGTNGTTASITTRGGSKAFSTGYDTAVVTITPVNDAPVLVAAGDPVLTSIPKNVVAANNTGTLVSTIIASMSPNGSITDADPGAKQGIAIIGANQVSGTWQFATDGTTWNNFGTIAATNTLLLAADAKTKIRFVPNLNYTGTVGFTFAAWDQTSGANGAFISLSASGGSMAFSAVRDNAYISVT